MTGRPSASTNASSRAATLSAASRSPVSVRATSPSPVTAAPSAATSMPSARSISGCRTSCRKTTESPPRCSATSVRLGGSTGMPTRQRRTSAGTSNRAGWRPTVALPTISRYALPPESASVGNRPLGLSRSTSAYRSPKQNMTGRKSSTSVLGQDSNAMKTNTIFARGAFAAGAFAIAASMFVTPAAAQPKPAAGTPVPKILVINREAILRLSKVGQDIVKQVNGYTQSAEKEFKGQGEQLRKDGAALQQQLAILAPDVKAKKIADFENRQRSLQAKVEMRQQQIQGGVLQARQKIETALGPIVQGIMQERGATLLLDRGAIVWGTGDIDITRTAIQRLDQKMQTVKVNLVSPPQPAKQG